MGNLLDGIEEVLLMGPGPSCVSDEVYKALGRKTIGHLNPKFIKIMDSIKGQLQSLLQTKNRLTVPLSGTGSAGMEAIFVNLVEPGDRVLILQNGVFGMRMAEVANRLKARTDVLEFVWGSPVDVDIVKDQLARKDYQMLAVVHAETSTGVCNPIAAIGELVAELPCLYLVDAVTSLGGIEVAMDGWHIDALYSGTQKCLSCPPGLAPISLSEAALKKLMTRADKVPHSYLDLSLIANYWEGEKRTYHHTAPINMLYGLYQALYLILEEGQTRVFQRHWQCHEQLVAGLEDLGLKMLVEETCRLPMLNAVEVPRGIDEAVIRCHLLDEYQIEIGAGLGPLAGKTWRIGLVA